MTHEPYDLYDVKTWSLNQLRTKIKGLHHAIHQVGRYHIAQVNGYDSIKAELKARGYTIKEVNTITITKE